MDRYLTDSFKKFESLSLDELNSTAALLDRSENKYLLEVASFANIIDTLCESFRILQIGSRRSFYYKSTYFDTRDLKGYTYHAQGRTKRRFKIRTRQYVDSDLHYFEVKLKDKRNGTIKKRIPYQSENTDKITPVAEKFLKKVYKDVYSEKFNYKLRPLIKVNYNRITLVAKAGGERMTIDFNLHYENESTKTEIKPLVIIETKSADGRGIADAILRKHGIKPRSCSKYCLGANLLNYDVKYNLFKPLLKFYSNLPSLES